MRVVYTYCITRISNSYFNFRLYSFDNSKYERWKNSRSCCIFAFQSQLFNWLNKFENFLSLKQLYRYKILIYFVLKRWISMSRNFTTFFLLWLKLETSHKIHENSLYENVTFFNDIIQKKKKIKKINFEKKKKIKN